MLKTFHYRLDCVSRSGNNLNLCNPLIRGWKKRRSRKSKVKNQKPSAGALSQESKVKSQKCHAGTVPDGVAQRPKICVIL